MKSVSRLLLASAIIAGSFCAAYAVDGKHVSGRAVSVHWRNGGLNWGPAACDCGIGSKGAIDLFTIQNGAVAAVDTIYDGSQGFAYYPAFNLDATKIVFYRSKTGKTGTTCATVNGGKNTIALLNIATRQVANVCDLPCNVPGQGGLDWPVGDWVYYVYPQCTAFPTDASTDNNEVWKVNTKTGENVKICKYTAQGKSMPNCTIFRRFSLNLAADKMAVQALQKYQCTDPSWFCNNIVSFPGTCDINAGGGNCNISISASGGYNAYYFGTGHSFICFSGSGAPSQVTIDQWQAVCPDQFAGLGAELIRWAVNSDKWVLQQIGWYGHAGSMGKGTNQVACNWADMVAIRISNNPKVPQEPCNVAGQKDCCGGCGAIYTGNCTGDMWIDGGAANAGKYEDGSGTWHSVPGYIQTGVYMPAAGHSVRHPAASVDGKGHVRIDLPFAGRSWVQLIDVRGIVVYAAYAAGGALAPASELGHGIYLVRVEHEGVIAAATISISR